MSTTIHHPDQITLPGQTATPAGPADLTMMYVMHHAFRRDLSRFADAVVATPLDDRATWRALAARWDRFFTILHHHHTMEDLYIWPFLLQRASGEDLHTLEAMEAEHEQIDPLLSSVAQGFAALAADRLPAGADDLRAALSVRLAGTRDSLARHLEHEETEALVVLQRVVTAEDWHRIEKEQIGKNKVPLPLPFLVGWCAEGVPAKEMDEVFAIVGKGFKVLWLLTRGGFRRGERRAFRHLG